MFSRISIGAVVAQLAMGVAASPCKTVALNATVAAWQAKYPGATVQSADVVVVGGGSAGSNAAINIVDAGKSVLLIEKQAQLVGSVFVERRTRKETMKNKKKKRIERTKKDHI